MSRTQILATVSLLSGAAYATDPTPYATTDKEVVKAENKDDQTGVALAALDEALQRNAKQAFDANANKAIDALKSRKSGLQNKPDQDLVEGDIKRASDKLAQVNKMPENSAWKNDGMELKTQLTAIDRRLDQAELATGTAAGSPPGK